MFSHAFDFAFEVTSAKQDASDVTPAMLRLALLRRAITVSDAELVEACDCFDTAEVSHD
ncbi:hypothetical protein [Paenirhodobacter populi]|uniref:hypothetical protein n=1 Tax=Paenirhodobacter populi TaxID=2306993 RepID=UPI0013E3992D|nr:hypothetical protein [Sinirhodobacter populi]